MENLQAGRFVLHIFVQLVGKLLILQRALYNLGMTGIPITNVNNNCSTGSTALFNAATLVKAGAAECALALGFERMSPGSLKPNFPDREPPLKLLGRHSLDLEEDLSTGTNHGPGAPRMFSNGAQEYFDKYGAIVGHLGQIGEG
jgi:sterol carrier protein 2